MKVRALGAWRASLPVGRKPSIEVDSETTELEPVVARDQDHGQGDSLGDFTTTPSILRLVPLAIVIGALGAGISLALLDMIGFFTNLFYYQRISVHLVSPNANTLGNCSGGSRKPGLILEELT
jgi:hypothetical protein